MLRGYTEFFHFNYGMIFAFAFFSIFLTSFQIASPKDVDFCDFNVQFMYYSGITILSMGALFDLLFDIFKVVKFFCLRRTNPIDMSIGYPSNSNSLLNRRIRLHDEEEPVSRKLRCFLTSEMVVTITVRLVSNSTMAAVLPHLALFPYLRGSCVTPEAHRNLIIETIILVIMSFIRYFTTCTFTFTRVLS